MALWFFPQRKVVLSPEYTVHIIFSIWGNCYLIETPEVLVLFDTLEPFNYWRIIRLVKKLGKPLSLIFISHAHFDHYGNALKVHNTTGAPIAAPLLDADLIRRGASEVELVHLGGHLGKLLLPVQNFIYHIPPTEPDILYEEGCELKPYGIDARVLHLPGHTHGHSGILLASTWLFPSDLVVVQPFPMIQCYYAYDWGVLIRSFERIKKLSPELIFPGFGRVLEGREIHDISYTHIEKLNAKEKKRIEG
jgi:hydroxyacylglutathione hydrolase